MFEEIKERVDIEQAARFYGIEFARGHMAHCPFHQAFGTAASSASHAEKAVT